MLFRARVDAISVILPPDSVLFCRQFFMLYRSATSSLRVETSIFTFSDAKRMDRRGFSPCHSELDVPALNYDAIFAPPR